MGETQLPAIRPELYERLIDRLGLALETARTSVRLRDEMPAELELRGLSHAEFEVIKPTWIPSRSATMLLSAVTHKRSRHRPRSSGSRTRNAPPVRRDPGRCHIASRSGRQAQAIARRFFTITQLKIDAGTHLLTGVDPSRLHACQGGVADADPILHQTMADAAGRAVLAAACGMVAA